MYLLTIILYPNKKRTTITFLISLKMMMHFNYREVGF